MVTKCSESGSNPSSCVLHLPLHLMPLEPLVDAILVVQLHSGRKATAPSPLRQLEPNTKERIANQTGDEDAVEKKDGDWAYDCTIDVISIRLDSCILHDLPDWVLVTSNQFHHMNASDIAREKAGAFSWPSNDIYRACSSKSKGPLRI